MTGVTRAPSSPDRLAELEEERRFLLRSLEDLEREHEVGDVDDHDYHELKDGYTARAATVIKAIDDGRAARPRTPPRWGRIGAWAAALLVVAVGAGVLVARLAGQRLPGETVTGGIAQDTNSRLAQARALLGTDPAQSLALYTEVLRVDPDNVEARTYSGWLLSIQAGQRGNEALVKQTEGLLDQAIELDPQRADAYCFKAVVRFRYLHDAATAKGALDRCEALDPPSEVSALVASLGAEIDAALAGGTSVAPPDRHPSSAGLLRSGPMSDVPPPPEPTSVPPPPPPTEAAVSPAPLPVVAPGMPPVAPPPPPDVTYGVVPQSLDDVFYKPGMNILLFIVTCGIWGWVWSFRTHGDLKRYKGDGLGEAPALIIAILLLVVIMFTVPYEIEQMYKRDGRQSPVSTIWGLWFLLPIVGQFIWYFKVQAALNDFWASKGAHRAL